MKTLAVFLVLTLFNAAEASQLSACSGSWRVGQRLIHPGDSLSSALDAIDRMGSSVRWIKGPRGNRWSLVESGRNPQTVSIRLRGGRIEQICQYRG